MKTLEINCNKCINLRADKNGCEIFGDDPKNAVKNCSADCFKNYKDITKQ